MAIEIRMDDLNNAFLSAALRYAARGWPVFPCNQDKRPIVASGFKAATCDPQIIRRWWAMHPDAAIGIACGAAGIVVVDCDVKVAGVDGIKNFEALGIDDAGALHGMTPSGGLHYVYKDTTDGKIRNSAGKLAPGIDIRANGGYIIAAPSVVNGGEYAAVEEWDKARLGFIPDALVELLTAKQKAPEYTVPMPDFPPAAGTHTTKPNGRKWADAAMRNELAELASSSEGTDRKSVV